MTTFRKAITLLTPSERRRAVLVCLLVVVTAVFEVAGVSSVVPFLTVLADPQAVERNDLFATAYRVFSFESERSFLFFLGIATFAFLMTSALVRSGGYYALYRFTQMLRHSIGARLLETYLRQPYEFFLDRHTGDLAKTILSEVDQLINQAYQPAATMVASLFTLIAISALIIALDPWIALTAALLLVGAYAGIFFAVKRQLGTLGVRRLEANRKRFETTSEALGGFKDIRLLGQETAYLRKFEGPSHSMSRFTAVALILGQLPKYIVEAIAFGGILLLALILMGRQDSQGTEALGTVVPLVGLYALAGYRLLPAVQAIYHASTQLRFGAASVHSVYRDLQEARHLPGLAPHRAAPLGVRESVEARSLTYTYPGAETAGVHDVSVTIPAGTTLGIIGTTGAGKTTLVDLILGMLRPTSGAILVDGAQITDDRVRAWQATIGYVPQDIFLVDGSISANIALGVRDHDIDEGRVRECALMAQLATFVEQELPNGYATSVGERGVRLSGGQRQRIGIARALYYKPDFLVFDEATSALDNVTEKDLMDAVRELRGQNTIVMIAHRLSTVRDCDQIIVLDGGRVVGRGTYAELEMKNATFQKIARVARAV